MKNNPSNLRDRQVYMHDSQIPTAMFEYGFKLMILLKPGKYNIRHVITAWTIKCERSPPMNTRLECR